VALSIGRKLSKNDLRAQSKIKIVGGDPTGRYEKKMRKVLRESFTQEELRKMGPVRVRFGKVAYGNRAAFFGQEHDDFSEIIFDPKQIEDDDIVHEFVHVLKDGDTSRKGYAAAGNIKQRLRNQDNRKDVRNIEEATVVAESAIRTKKPAKDPSGYYREVPGVGNDKRKRKAAYKADRNVLLEKPKGKFWAKSVQGKAAVKKLNKNFTKTNISKKKVGGKTALASMLRLK